MLQLTLAAIVPPAATTSPAVIVIAIGVAITPRLQLGAVLLAIGLLPLVCRRSLGRQAGCGS